MLTLGQIRNILVALVVVLASSVAYIKVYHNGYEDAEQKYQAIIAKDAEEREARARDIESKITSLTTGVSAYNQALLQDMQAIKNGLAGKTLVLYKDGKCQLSPDFLEARDRAIERANKK